SSDLVQVAQILGIACASLALVSIVLIQKPARFSETPPALYAVLVLALLGPFAAWATGGLETPLLVALLGFGLLNAVRFIDDPARRRKRLWAAGACLALAC